MIIGITGKKGHGKSMAAKFLADNFDVTRLNFKDELIRELKQKFPNLLEAILDVMNKTAYDGLNEWTVDRLFDEKPPLVRALMQNYGTEVRRADKSDYWADRWTKRAIETLGNIVVDDVRFLNEAKAIRDLGGIIIRIVRTDAQGNDNHSSEIEMDSIEVDHEIPVGTGQQEFLFQALKSIVTDPTLHNNNGQSITSQ